MLLSICPTPYEAIIEELESLLSKSRPSTKIKGFSVTEVPSWLVSVGHENLDGMATVSRIGISLEFQLNATSPGYGESDLHGVFTWVIANVGREDRKSQFWLDVNGTLAEFGNEGEMISRFYGL